MAVSAYKLEWCGEQFDKDEYQLIVTQEDLGFRFEGHKIVYPSLSEEKVVYTPPAGANRLECKARN